MQSCSIRKHIPKDQHLLSKVKIKGEPTAYSDEVYALLKQKPNKKILGLFRVNMWSYLWANKSKMKKRRERKLANLNDQLAKERKQLREIPADDIKKRENQEYKIFNLENKVDKQREKVASLSRGVFEPPVLLDTFLASSSASQIQAYLFNKGYFYNTVTQEVIKRRVKAKVVYTVKPGNRVRVNEVEYLIYDSTLAPLVINDSLKSEIKPGRFYDGDELAMERERLYNVFRNSGYFNFSREYVYYGLDSALSGDVVDVYLGIANPPKRPRHRIYKFDKIYIEPEYFLGDSLAKDTIAYGDHYYISNGPHIKPRILSDFVFFHKDEIFRLNDYQSTLNRLSQLNLFRFVDVQFAVDTIGRNDTGLLSAYIRLSPMKRQEISNNIEFNYADESQMVGGYANRSLGISGSVVYKNRNISKSGLQLEIRPRASLEVPIDSLQVSGINKPSYELGISNSLIFPQLLIPFYKIKDQGLRLSSQTSVNLNFLYENNFYFNRTTLNTNLTYQVKKGKFQHFITPIEVSLVNTGFNSDTFRNAVYSTGDPLLINLFDQHIITDFRYALVIGQQPVTNVARRYWFFRNSVETGGNLLTAVTLFERNVADTNPTKRIFGINYYSYLRDEIDLRFYSPVWRENNFAWRGIVGLGLPIWGSDILPFERRFYVGGANSIRAWRLRELGPGSYKDKNDLAFDKSGDLKIETNAEFRFPIYGLFKGALFVDAGNVWTYKEDEARPGAKFQFHDFYNQFAVGTGLGLRFDFTFFVLRTDFALPVRDPSRTEGDRYVIDNIDKINWVGKNIRMHLGIGYPF